MTQWLAQLDHMLKVASLILSSGMICFFLSLFSLLPHLRWIGIISSACVGEWGICQVGSVGMMYTFLTLHCGQSLMCFSCNWHHIKCLCWGCVLLVIGIISSACAGEWGIFQVDSVGMMCTFLTLQCRQSLVHFTSNSTN